MNGSHSSNHIYLWLCSSVISRDKKKRYIPHFLRTYNHQSWHRGDLDWGVFTYQSHVPLIMWSCDANDKLKSLYLHFHKSYKHQAQQSGNFGLEAPTHEVIWPSITLTVVMWQIRNVTSVLVTNINGRVVIKSSGLSPIKSNHPFVK